MRNTEYFQTARGVSSYSETTRASVQFLGVVLTVGLCEINDGSVDCAVVVRASSTSRWQSGSMARERMKPEFDAGPKPTTRWRSALARSINRTRPGSNTAVVSPPLLFRRPGWLAARQLEVRIDVTFRFSSSSSPRLGSGANWIGSAPGKQGSRVSALTFTSLLSSAAKQQPCVLTPRRKTRSPM